LTAQLGLHLELLGLLPAAAVWQGVLLFQLHDMDHTTAEKVTKNIICEGWGNGSSAENRTMFGGHFCWRNSNSSCTVTPALRKKKKIWCTANTK
jgi:hypothetical protein